MKKVIAILLAVMLVVSIAPTAFADSTTTLTTNVPGATYEFSIPEDTEIEYNATCTSIGYVTVTKSSGFAVGKNLKITLEYGPFVNTNNSESTIPYSICADTTTSLSDTSSNGAHDYEKKSGTSFTFKGLNTGNVQRLAFYSTYSSSGTYYYGDLAVHINSADWGKALGGDYTSTITFTAEVVQD